jgi:hypothetical protein
MKIKRMVARRTATRVNGDEGEEWTGGLGGNVQGENVELEMENKASNVKGVKETYEDPPILCCTVSSSSVYSKARR